MVTILIIDDKQTNIFALEELLRKPDRIIVSAPNGKDGLKIVLHKDVDLIILDVQMPEMDGFEVAKVLRSHRRTKDIPIIFASAEKKERDSIMKGFEEGAVDYLPKPLDPDVTRAKVSVLLKMQRQKRELVEMNLSLQKAEGRIGQLNGELEENLTRLQAVNKELESFSYSVSHDLRAPLRVIGGYSKILLEDYAEKLDDDAKRLLGVIDNNAARMDKLIEDLLQFSKLGKTELTKSIIDSEALVRLIVGELSTSMNHSAEVRLLPLVNVSGDSALLSQVWINLISNAIKYSSKTLNPVIEIGCRQTSQEVIHWVKDNGAGFDMKFVENLFGVFQRLHKRDEFEGTGIGLALVQRIITRHGGRVWAEAKVNEGATFYFSLPGG